ncbi:MAG TPA: GIY-YIG nuclease family protein [Candidatus Absconditabacterales bacterium]|nr:GIY-YIG nuclease family protein [Candidatus Absconditabacterales bacterium]
MKYTVYIIKSINHNYTYTGMTNNLERRLNEHNLGNTPSNKKYAPFKLIYHEIVENSKIARQREKYLKGGNGRNRLKKQLETTQ